MERVIIFGGTGFIGQSLAKHLSEKGITPVIIARNKPEKLDFEFYKWNARSLGNWFEQMENALAVVNLAGKSVDCVKTEENKDIILRSRVESTKTIGKAFQQLSNPPKVWVQMSTAHIYGDPSYNFICDEDSAFGHVFATKVGKAWEKAFLTVLPNLVRGVRLRTSFVIGKDGGALASLMRIVKLRLGGKVGNGKQGISWIHEYDMNEIIFQAIKNNNYKDAYIASSPNPVSNEIFMSTLRKVMKIRLGIPSPEFLTRFGATNIFKTDPELAIKGRYVVSKRLQEHKFKFKFPELEDALIDLIQ